MPRTHLLALALASLAAPALAGTPINETRRLDPQGRVEIENLKGRIQVRAWDRNEVQVTGTLGAGAERLSVEGSGSHLSVEVKYPDGSWGRRGDKTEPTILLLKVPLQASLDIDSVSAEVDVAGVAPRELEIESVSGAVTVAAAPRSASISSVSGMQKLTLNSAGDVDVESVSGDVQLRGRLKGAVHAETVSGNVTVDTLGESLRKFGTSTVSGDITARMGLANGGEIRGETVSGDITLHLPKATSARVVAESFTGDLTVPGATAKKEEFGPGSSLDARLGGGAGEIHVETFSGDFDINLD